MLKNLSENFQFSYQDRIQGLKNGALLEVMKSIARRQLSRMYANQMRGMTSTSSRSSTAYRFYFKSSKSCEVSVAGSCFGSVGNWQCRLNDTVPFLKFIYSDWIEFVMNTTFKTILSQICPLFYCLVQIINDRNLAKKSCLPLHLIILFSALSELDSHFWTNSILFQFVIELTSS